MPLKFLNAENDPADYFEYIMFAWGNCQAGDRLVMERKLGRFPDETDLSTYFSPGIRFYFKYDDLVKHPNTIFDGVLPMKVKDKVIYVENDCKDIWDWSEKVYRVVEGNGK